MSTFPALRRPLPLGRILATTVTDPDEPDPGTDPDMPIAPIPRDQILDALTWLRDEVYTSDAPGAHPFRLVDHPLDDEGIAAWLCDAYESVGRYLKKMTHQQAKDYVYAEIRKAVGGGGGGNGGGGGGGVDPPNITGMLRTQGRIFADDEGPRFPAWASCLYGLADDRDPRPLLDQLAALGFGGVRVFGGHLSGRNQTASSARAKFPTFLAECHARGLRVELTACTDTVAGNYDLDAHVIACAQMNPDALELFNEVGHPSQVTVSRDRLLELMNRARDAGRYAGPIALGAASIDELPWNEAEKRVEDYPTAGGSYITVHLQRGRRPFYAGACRLTEQRAIAERHGVVTMNNEPERVEDLDNPVSFAYLMGLLGRGFNGGTFFHSARARVAQRLDGIQLEAAMSFIRGHQQLRESRGAVSFKNGHWSDSPVSKADYIEGEGAGWVKSPSQKTIWRVHAFLTDANNGIAVWSGPDPARAQARAEWRNGWRAPGVVDELAGVRVTTIHRD